MNEASMMASLPQSTPALTILIADDHWVVRESLKQVARSIDPSVNIKEAATLEQAISVLERYPLVGLVLVDLVMPGMNEFEGLELLRRRFPTIAIAVITIHEDPNYVRQAIQNGVIGYIPKSASADEIRRAFTRIFGGEVYFPRDLLTRSWTVAADAPAEDTQPVDGPRVSARENEILTLLGEGRGVAEIAEMLGITPQTVRVHLGNAMRKLGLKSREAAVLYAVTHSRKEGNR
jgi:DNA-binding NarL/FixJ family response regulator